MVHRALFHTPIIAATMPELFGVAISGIDITFATTAAWLLYKLTQAIRMRVKTTKMRGPPASNWLLGVSREVFQGDSGALFESWSEEYGVAFQIPTALGSRRTVLFDPRAIAHFYSKETFGYVQNSFTKKAISNLVRFYLYFLRREDESK